MGIIEAIERLREEQRKQEAEKARLVLEQNLAEQREKDKILAEQREKERVERENQIKSGQILSNLGVEKLLVELKKNYIGIRGRINRSEFGDRLSLEWGPHYDNYLNSNVNIKDDGSSMINIDSGVHFFEDANSISGESVVNLLAKAFLSPGSRSEDRQEEIRAKEREAEEDNRRHAFDR